MYAERAMLFALVMILWARSGLALHPNTELFHSVTHDNGAALKRLLAAHPYDRAVLNNALLLSAAKGRSSVIRDLLDAGANDINGAVILAAHHNQYVSVHTLSNSGASLSSLKSALHLADLRGALDAEFVLWRMLRERTQTN